MEDPALVNRSNHHHQPLEASPDFPTRISEGESRQVQNEDAQESTELNPASQHENHNDDDDTAASNSNNNVQIEPVLDLRHATALRNMPSPENDNYIDARTMSHLYVLFSIFIALLAIVSPPGQVVHHHKRPLQKGNSASSSTAAEPKYAVLHGDLHSSMRKLLDEDQNIKIHDKLSAAVTGQFTSVEQVAKAAATANLFKFKDSEETAGGNAVGNKDVNSAVVTEDGDTNLFKFFGFSREEKPQVENPQEKKQADLKAENEGGFPSFLGWIDALNPKNHPREKKVDEKPMSMKEKLVKRFVDPSLIELANLSSSSRVIGSKSKVATEVVDKILSSTPRIVTIINLLLAVTYLLHSIVASLFLGEASMRANEQSEQEVGIDDPTMLGMGGGGVGASASDRMHRSGRERLGGYLLFKLLLITAVVEPDTLDLLILLSWYTLLAFLRSLAYLAGITTAHTAASGQPPHRGVWKLLVAVLVCDISAATTCAALFHGAGVGMVALLLCDCLLLGLDIMTHLARFTQQILEESHQTYTAELERRQIHMYEDHRNGVIDSMGEAEESDDSETEIQLLSRQIDHEMELAEESHLHHLKVLDNMAFFLELLALIVTMCHFLHVWALHGVTFNLVDGVLALHLHSAVSAFGKKVAERKNHNRIARDLDKCFDDASDIELTKASAAGDVCSICLGTMTMGQVKKVGCGHMFHTQCLREIVERARSIEAARCPLCRASVLDGSQVQANDNMNGTPQGIFFGTMANIAPILTTPQNNIRNQQDANNPQSPTESETPMVPAPAPPAGQERALFRLSTEGLLPNWLPIPAFSFEVVRRFPNDAGGETGNTDPAQPSPAAAANNATNNQNVEPREEQEEPSFWRRFLVLAGAIPMSPEEETMALNQLTDMFPQYDRSALLRELRERGSAEGVVESILSGNFIGVNRNSERQEAFDENAIENLH